MRCVTPVSFALLLVLSLVARGAEPAWQSVMPFIEADSQAVAGEWRKENSGLMTNPAAGSRLMFPVSPEGEYDYRATFTRKSGVHSISLIFVHGAGQASVEVDAWGRHLAGIQNIGGKSIQENPTRRENVTLQNGRRYTLTVEVRKDQVRALLDDQVIATHRTTGADLTLPDVWRLPETTQLGIGAWESATTFHEIEVRSRGGKPLALGPAPKAPPSTGARPTGKPAATAPAASKVPSKTARGSGAGKHVLIVVANQDFFYREYGDPRQELERAGFRVTVGAGRRGVCRPHPGSGQGSDGGEVQADIALADVKVADYDAILFSGGWGSSAYQFAFPGRYSNPVYNGDRATKAAANRVINDFVKADKYVAALCNGVTVLAWARVDGKSPLAGRRVCAPTRQAAAGIYDGRPAQPSCRWHPEQNGAVMSPAGSIGRPGTAEDDVVVDGRIITGEDDISAREMGRRLVQVLSQ